MKVRLVQYSLGGLLVCSWQASSRWCGFLFWWCFLCRLWGGERHSPQDWGWRYGVAVQRTVCIGGSVLQCRSIARDDHLDSLHSGNSLGRYQETLSKTVCRQKFLLPLPWHSQVWKVPQKKHCLDTILWACTHFLVKHRSKKEPTTTGCYIYGTSMMCTWKCSFPGKL